MTTIDRSCLEGNPMPVTHFENNPIRVWNSHTDPQGVFWGTLREAHAFAGATGLHFRCADKQNLHRAVRIIRAWAEDVTAPNGTVHGAVRFCAEVVESEVAA